MSFSVGATPAAKRQADTLRGKAAKAYSEALVRLEAEGCAAADYRLTGETIDHICALHPYAGYRMLVCDREGGPPVDAELLDRLLVAARRFTRCRQAELTR